MVYQNKMVAAIKVNGKVLREQGDSVVVPFGSEYSILIKNLNSVRTLVDVSIDGEKVATDLVIGPNSSLDLERYIRNGNLKEGNKFKFLKRTAAIESHRGIRADDGIVRIEYKTEKIIPTYDWSYNYQLAPIWPRTRRWTDRGCFPTWQVTKTNTSGSIGGIRGQNSSNMSYNSAALPLIKSLVPVEDAGFTAPGSKSEQQFNMVSGFSTHSQSEVIVLRLKGEVSGQIAKEPVTVHTKKRCTSCGKVNRSSNKFCSGCGTALFLF